MRALYFGADPGLRGSGNKVGSEVGTAIAATLLVLSGLVTLVLG